MSPVRLNGDGLIARERQRQIEDEGWSAAHDAEHDEGDLARAAIAYLQWDMYEVDQRDIFEVWWPMEWGEENFKPKDRLRNLVRAGALVAAEIDRLLAAQSKEETR